MHYFHITEFDTANGSGIGSVLWVAGCNHNCPNCHNPQTHNPNAGQLFTDKTMEKLLESLSPPYITRLTISGGDPLFPDNRQTVTEICKKAKSLPVQIWLYTGYTFESVSHLPVFNYVDVCVDGPFIDSLKNLNLLYRGSSNQRIIKINAEK